MKNLNSVARRLLCTVAIGLPWGSMAGAQEETQREKSLVIEEIIVTAEAREENLQKVPVAVTAFSARDILEAGIESTADFIALTPNVSFDDSFTIGNSFVVVRGVTQINNADSPVAIVVDGVPQNNQKQFKMDLYDIERIEVLKGPQGALYGRNAIGGAINIVTKAPGNELEGSATYGTGNGSFRKYQANVSGALVDDKLMWRLSGSHKESDGLIDNDFLGTRADFYKSTDFRIKFLWYVSSQVTMDFRFSASRLKGGAIYDAAFWDNTGPENTNQERAPVMDILGTSKRNIGDATVKLDWVSDLGTLTYIGGFTDLKEDYYGDLDFCNPTDCPEGFFGFGQVDQMQDLEVKLLSHEVRLTSPDDQRFRWALGAFLIGTDRTLGTVANIVESGASLALIKEDNENEASALFGQVEYDISDEFELSASLRYDKDEREQTDAATGDEREAEYSAIQPKVTLTWTPVDDQLGYLSYANGFRSGGFNGIGGREFDEERVNNFEIGYKSRWLGGRAIFNAAAYLAKSEGFQFFFVDVGSQVIDNLDEVTLSGLELEFKALITDKVSVFGALGIQDSKIDAIEPNLPVPASIGNRTPKNTSSSFNLGTQIEFTLNDHLDGVFRVDFERRGSKYWHADNVDVMGGVSLLNARVSVYAGNWTLTWWGRNLTNEFYFEDFSAQAFTGLPWNIAWPGRPKSYGIDFRYDF